MEVVYLITFFIVGTVFGSFYNVVGERLSLNKSIVKPASHCLNCNHVLNLLEMIPILSYIFLRGRCQKCKQKISIFYPLMELISGVLFAVCYYSFGFSFELIIGLLLSSLLIIVIVSDLNYYIIPDQVNIFFAIVLTIIYLGKYGLYGGISHIINGIILFVCMYLLMLLGNFLFKKESLGGGDVKLMYSLGVILPMPLSFLALLISSVIALFSSIILLKIKKEKIIPFGPFLVIGTLLVFLLKINVADIIKLLT